MTRRRHRWRDERGSVSVELVIIAPLFALVLVAVIAVGRVSNGRADVESAAQMAARQLSIDLDVAAAERIAATTLDVGSPSCRTMTFSASIGAELVDVTVTCSVAVQDGEGGSLPLPSSLTVTGSASEVRDVHRENAGEVSP